MDNENLLNKKFSKEIASGISSLVLLRLMEQQEEAMYGYQIAKLLIAASSDQKPLIKQGAIYPVLRSLEKNGLLTSEVEPSISGPPRRYYLITENGKKTLKDWIKIWEDSKKFADAILKRSKQ